MFIKNDGTYLYLALEINPANKVCFECPDGTGPSDKWVFNFDTTGDAKSDLSFVWAYGKTGNSPLITTGPESAPGIPCTSPLNCPSPTVYEARIPIASLCASLPCTVGFWASSHASPHGNVCTRSIPCPPPPPPPPSVPEFDAPIATLLGAITVVGSRIVQKRRKLSVQ